MSALIAAGIPSPSQGVWYLGPIPLRAYGIIIAAGVICVQTVVTAVVKLQRSRRHTESSIDQS